MPWGQINSINVVVEQRQLGVSSSPQLLLVAGAAARCGVSQRPHRSRRASASAAIISAAAAAAPVVSVSALAAAPVIYVSAPPPAAAAAADADRPGCAQSARGESIQLHRDSPVGPPDPCCHADERRVWNAWQKHGGHREELISFHACIRIAWGRVTLLEFTTSRSALYRLRGVVRSSRCLVDTQS